MGRFSVMLGIGLAIAACAPTTPTCDSPQTICGATCIDTSREHDHCGNCTTACAVGEVCFDGVCAADCGGGTTKCGDACFDTRIDPQNCGACGVSCGAGQACNHAVCSSTCDVDQQLCIEKDGAHCVAPLTDNANCGGCGVVCGTEEVCSNGVCGSACSSDQSLCTPTNEHPYCATTETDNANCGACGVLCDDTLGCVAGECAPICSSQETACIPTTGTPYCTNIANDPDNCGGCAVSCGQETYCSNAQCACVDPTKKWCGACTDVNTDASNCGYCGNACNGDCSLGRCEVTLATQFFSAASIAADDLGAYVTWGSVWFVPSGGGAPTNLTATYSPVGLLGALALDDTDAYFVDANSSARICKVPKGGGTVSVLATLSESELDITSDANNVYARGANGIYSVPLAGGSVVTLASGDGQQFEGHSIATDGTNVYWLSDTGIQSVATGGGATKTLRSDTTLYDLVYSNDRLYFYDENFVLQQMAPTWTNAEFVTALNGAYALTAVYEIFAVDSSTLVAIDPTTLFRTSLVDDINLGSYASLLAANSKFVFWIDWAGNLRRVAY